MDLSNLTWRKSKRSLSNGGECVELAGLVWRKATHSGSNAAECVELAGHPWRKSQRSGPSGGDCVELAQVANVVAVRDSKDPGGPAILVTPSDLRAAIRAATANI